MIGRRSDLSVRRKHRLPGLRRRVVRSRCGALRRRGDIAQGVQHRGRVGASGQEKRKLEIGTKPSGGEFAHRQAQRTPFLLQAGRDQTVGEITTRFRPDRLA